MKRTMIVAVDVTDLTSAERNALHGEIAAQCEASPWHPDATLLWTEVIDGQVPRPSSDI
jgi:hypothetical protein